MTQPENKQASNSPEVASKAGLKKIRGGKNFWNSLFQRDQFLWVKILGAGAATGLFLAGTCIKIQEESGDNINFILVGLVSVSGFFGGMILGSCLSIYDHVIKRIEAGENVPLLTKLYFGNGVLSLFLSLFTVAFFVVSTLFLYDLMNGMNWKW